MKKGNICKLFCLMCAGVPFLAFPENVFAFGFPTWDIGEVINTINGYTVEIQSGMATAQSTLSVGTLQQSIGDSVGGMEKFQNAKKKAEKLKEKQEKKMRALERKKKMAEKRAAKIKAAEKAIRAGVEDAKAAYKTAKEMYDEGMGYVEEGKAMYESGKEVFEMGQGIFGENEQNPSADGEDISQNPEISASASDADFSEGQWSEGLGKFAEMENLPADDTAVATDGTVGMKVQQGIQKAADVSLADKGDAAKVSDAKLSENKGQLTRKQFGQPEAGQSALPAKGSTLSEKNAASGNAAALSSIKADKVSPDKGGAAARLPTAGIKPEAAAAVKQSQPKADIRRKTFTTSEKNAFYQVTTPVAFAQLGGGVKSGYTDLDKFVFSDEIASVCDMGIEDVTEEKVAECVKTFVMGMTDPNAGIASEWKKKFQTILHDHVSQDLAGALMQKSYAAAFQTEVADDLENKADATSSERDQFSYNGKVSQTSQEIIIRLMEAMTSQLVTDSLQVVGRLDRSYYEQDSE